MESTDDLSLESSQNPEAISKAKKDERARKKRAYRLRKKLEASGALRVPYEPSSLNLPKPVHSQQSALPSPQLQVHQHNSLPRFPALDPSRTLQPPPAALVPPIHPSPRTVAPYHSSPLLPINPSSNHSPDANDLNSPIRRLRVAGASPRVVTPSAPASNPFRSPPSDVSIGQLWTPTLQGLRFGSQNSTPSKSNPKTTADLNSPTRRLQVVGESPGVATPSAPAFNPFRSPLSDVSIGRLWTPTLQGLRFGSQDTTPSKPHKTPIDGDGSEIEPGHRGVTESELEDYTENQDEDVPMDIDDSDSSDGLRQPLSHQRIQFDNQKPRPKFDDDAEIPDSEPARALLQNHPRSAYAEDDDESELDGDPPASTWGQRNPLNNQDPEEYQNRVLQGFGHRQSVQGHTASGFGFLADQAGSETHKDDTRGEMILNVSVPGMSIGKGHRAPEMPTSYLNVNSATDHNSEGPNILHPKPSHHDGTPESSDADGDEEHGTPPKIYIEVESDSDHEYMVSSEDIATKGYPPSFQVVIDKPSLITDPFAGNDEDPSDGDYNPPSQEDDGDSTDEYESEYGTDSPLSLDASESDDTYGELTVEDAEKSKKLLRSAWNMHCRCDTSPPDVSSDVKLHDLGELAEYWDQLVPPDIPRPIGNREVLKPSHAHGGYRDIQWKKMLAGRKKHPVGLDIGRTQATAKEFDNIQKIVIERTWDVDSFIARVDSLAAFKGGFFFAYTPPFQSRLTQDLRVKIGGKVVTELKNMRLGSTRGPGGSTLTCHAVFPRMTKGKGKAGTQITSNELEIWINHIVVPALEACENGVPSHHPRSYEDAVAKAKSLSERYLWGRNQLMDIRYGISETDLEPFWDAIQGRAQRFQQFRDIILVVSGHNLKMPTSGKDLGRVQSAFFNELEMTFKLDLMPIEDCWLDLGMEDTPRAEPKVGITLLRKTGCCQNWSEMFKCPGNRQSPNIVARQFLWAMTRDAGSVDVALGARNHRNKMGGIAYNKQYNLHKDVFATPVKNLNIFDSAHLEALGYTQELISKWYEMNKKGGGKGHARTLKKRILQTYKNIKARANTSLYHAHNTSFGVRQEYRINIQLFQKLDTAEELKGFELIRRSKGSYHEFRCRTMRKDSHLAYFVLPTSVVNDYVKADLNRYLLLIEALMLQATSRPDFPAVSQGQQLVNGVMISALLRTIRLAYGNTNPERHPALWLDKWEVKSKANHGNPGPPKLGLGYSLSVQGRGCLWLPRKLIQWHILPTFKSRAIKHLGLHQNRLQQQLHRTFNIQRNLSREDNFYRLFERTIRGALRDRSAQALKPRMQKCMDTGAELVIQRFYLDLMKLLAERAEIPGSGDWQVKKFLEDFDEKIALGLYGLSYRLVEEIIEGPPSITSVRPFARRNARKRTDSLPIDEFLTGYWYNRIEGLFAWHKENPKGKQGLVWDDYPYRILGRSLSNMIQEVVSSEISEQFGQKCRTEFFSRTCDVASQKLWIIPHYNATRLSQLKTDKDRQSTKLGRTTWLMPMFDDDSVRQAANEAMSVRRQLERMDRAQGGIASPDKFPQLKTLLVSKIEMLRKKVANHLSIAGLRYCKVSSGHPYDLRDQCVTDPEFFGFDTSLHKAKLFLSKLEEIIAEQEARGSSPESSDEVESDESSMV